MSVGGAFGDVAKGGVGERSGAVGRVDRTVVRCIGELCWPSPPHEPRVQLVAREE